MKSITHESCRSLLLRVLPFLLLAAAPVWADIVLNPGFTAPPNYTPGSTGSWTLTVQNTGDMAETDLDVATSFPTGATVTAASCSTVGTGSVCDNNLNSGELASTGNKIAVGGSISFSLTLSYTANMALDPLAATATITSSDPTQSSAPTASSVLRRVSDISVTKTSAASNYTPGESGSFIVTVTNDGPSDAPGLTLVDSAPSGMTIGNWNCTPQAQCPVNSGSGNLSQSLNLAAGVTLTYTLPATFASSATANPLVNTASVTVPASLNDPDTADQQASVSLTRDAQVDLSVAFPSTGLPSSYVPGTDGTTISFSVANAGPSNARNAALTLDWTSAVSAVSWSCAPTSACTPSSGTADIAATVDLAAGASAVVSATLDFNPGARADLALEPQIAAASDETDTDADNDSDSLTLAVDRRADIQVTKTASSATVNPGASFTYEIVVENLGPGNLGPVPSDPSTVEERGVLLTDLFPAGLLGDLDQCGDADVPCWTVCANDLATVGDYDPDNCPTTPIQGSGPISDQSLALAAGSSTMLRAFVRASGSASGEFFNRAEVRLDPGPPALVQAFTPGRGSDFSEVTTPIELASDIRVFKTDSTEVAVAGARHSYVIEVINDGFIQANNIGVVDSLPLFDEAAFPAQIDNAGFIPGTISWQCQAFNGACCNSGTSNCGTGTPTSPIFADILGNGVDLPGQSRVRFTVAGTLDPRASGTLLNEARLSIPDDIGDPNTANNISRDDNTAIVSQADLRINKRLLPLDDDDGVAPFSLVYRIEVENLGPSFAAGASVSDALSSDALDNSTATWTCAPVVNPGGQTRCIDAAGTGPLLAEVDLEPGGKVGFNLEVDTTATPTGQVRNDARVVFGSTVATDFVVSSLIGQTRLRVATTDNRAEIAPGETIDYTVRVENLGPDDVFGATVSDLFPPLIDSLTWSCEAVTPIPGDLDFLQLTGPVDTAGDGVVVSPDGRHVYVIGNEADSLYAFDRNSTPGLNFGEVVLLETEINGFNDASDPGPVVNGMDGPLDLAISADGFNVYVLSNPSVDILPDFTGQFEATRWSPTTQAFGCGSSSVTSSFSEVSLATANGCAAIFAGFTHSGATEAGTVSFDWSVTQSQAHSYVARFGIDGQQLETLSTNQPASGTRTIRVESGDQLRFTVSKSSGFGISTLMITDFNFTPDAESPPTLSAFSRSANPAAPDFGRLTFLGSISQGLPLAPGELTLTSDRIYVAGIGSNDPEIGTAPNIAIFNRVGVSGVPTFDAAHTDGVPTGLASLIAEPGGEWLFAGGQTLAMFSIDPAAGPLPAGRLTLVDTLSVDDRIGSLAVAGTAPQLYGRSRVGTAGRLVMVDYLDAGGNPLLNRRFTYSAADMTLPAGVTDPLTGAGRIDIAPDGEHLAGVSRDDNLVYTFRRDTISGGLEFAEAFATDQPAAGNNRGLAGAVDVQFAPDGRHLLIAASAFGSGTNPPLTVYARRAPEPLFAFLEADRQDDPGIDLLRAPNDVAVSPDGAHVYTVSLADNALLRFDRFPRAGLDEGTLGQHLQFVEAWVQGVGGVQGLIEPRRVLISPNGRSVYVTSELGNSIAVFDRENNPDSGTFGHLSFRERIVDGSGGVTGLAGAQGMAMDPASQHLYVAGSFAASIVRFVRHADGSLSFAERVVGGSAGVSGMNGIRDLEVSSDGRQLFGVSTQSNALVVFNRDADSGSDDFGQLSFVQAQVASIGVRPMAVASAPDGAHIYVVGQNSNSLAALRRVTNPASSAFGQVQPIGLLTSGSDGITFMNGPRDVVVSPDGKRIYVAAEFSNAVLVFDRDTNASGSRYGFPGLVEIRRNTVGGVDGLRQARAVAVSNDSRNVYVAGFGSGALASFRLGIGSLCTVAGSGIINDQVDIGVGGTILYRASGVVRPDATGTLENVAAVKLPENFQVAGVPDPGCPAEFQFCDSDSTTLVPRGRLTLEKTSDQVSVTAGETASYTVTISNAGPSSLMHEAGFPLTLSDPLDSNPAFVAGTASWSCVAEGSGGLDLIQVWRNLDPEDASSGPFTRLEGVTGLALVPTATGSWLAATSVVDDAVSLFSRDPFTGELVAQASVQSGELLSGQLVDSLDGAQAVYASSDGAFLYIASRVSDSITVLSVDADSNGLPMLGLVEIVRGVVGLNQALAIIASPDERFLYVAGGNDDAIAIFEREPVFGTLTLQASVQQGIGGVSGLTDVNQLVLSPDGEHLYALSPTAASVTLFDRDPVSGMLSWRQTWTELDFAVELDGLADGRFDPAVGLDPGGRHLYLAAGFGNRIIVLQRDTGATATRGTLSLLGTVDQGINGVNGLSGVSRLAVSADGVHVYASSPNSSTVAWFIRDQQSGQLSFAGLRGNTAGLGGATGLLLDPALNQLFVAGTGEGGIVLFERQADSFCPASGSGQLINVPFNVGAGGRVTFTIQVEVAGNASGSVENIAILEAARDIDNPNQTAAQSNVVSAEADLAITKSDGLSEIDGLAGAIAIAATGNYVYTAAAADNAIGVFARTVDPGTSNHGGLDFVTAARAGDDGVEGLSGVVDIAISADRAHLYAASPVSSSVASFQRQLATGRLNFLELEQNGLAGVSGLSGARAVALSPDDRHLYAVGGFANAVVSFGRDADLTSASYGRLEFLEFDQNGVGGVAGMGQPVALAVSSDGLNVYVLGAESDTLAVFTRNRTAASGNFGRLQYQSHLTNNIAGVAGLGGVRDVAVSADGAFVYVLGAETGTLARFARAPSTGALAFVDFKQDGTAGTSGLAGASSLLLDDAAGVLYVAGAAAEAIVRFAIDPDTGALDFIDRVDNGDPAPLTGGEVFGLEGVSALALPADGDHLYAASAGRDAVLGFRLPAGGTAPNFQQILIDGLGGVAPGTLVEYVITVENRGPSDVVQARVVDSFPPEFEAVQWTCSPVQGSAAQCLPGGNGDLDTLVNLPAGGRVTIRASGIIVAGATGRLVNTATVAGIGVTDPVPGNNSATDADTVLSPAADLVVSVDNGTVISTPGDSTRYIVEVANNGPSSVRSVFIEDQIPPALFDVTWSCTAEPAAGVLGAPLEVASLLAPNALAISADGRFAVAVGGDQLELFRRDPLTGKLLQPSQVLSQGAAANGIRNAQDVVIGADGRFVYVAGTDSDAIALFERDATTGELEFVARWQDGLGGIEGLGGVRHLLLSPEGGHLYAASGLDNALAIFAINATTGALTQTGLLVQGVATVDGLNDVADLTWVDGGRWLAAVADANQSLALFRRQPGGGLVVEDLLLNDDLLGGPAADSLLGASAVIANGTELLVAARDSDRIGRFLVVPGEQSTDPVVLVPIGAIDAVDVPGLEAPRALAWDSDQARLYVVDALGLQLLSLLGESPLRIQSWLHPDFDVLTAAAGLTLSPDLRHLYSFAADAAPSIGIWARERGSRCPLDGVREIGRQQVDIVAGGRLVYQVDGAIQANATGTLVYTVEAINPIAGQELNPGDNIATDTDTLEPAPDLAVDKTLNTVTVVAGLPIEWQVDIDNAGLSDADAARVIDPLPVYPVEASGILAGTGSWSCSANPPLDLLNAQAPGEALKALTLDETGGRLYAAGGDALWIFPLLGDGTLGTAEIMVNGLELPGGTIEGMTGTADVAVSRDGLSVYVAAATGDSLVVFTRESLSEPLDYVRSYTTTVPVSGDGVAGLRGARAVALSDDQRWVFVAGAVSNAVAVFERDLRTGTLEFVERVADGIGTIVPEFNVIRGVSDLHPALDGALYAIGSTSRALSRFTVSDQTGSLGFERVWRAADLGLADLDGLRGLSAAPGDTHLYALTDTGVLRFSRLDGGELQFDGRYEGLPEPTGARALVVDASGSRAYVLAETAAGTVVHVLKRDWLDGTLELWFTQPVNGIQPTALAQARNTRRLHVAGGDDALSSFAELALSRCRMPAFVEDGIDSEVDLGAIGDASFALTATVDPAARGEIINSVSVAPAVGTDPDLDNNSASVGAPITVISDIAVTKTGPVQAVAGSVIDYQITVTNAGPSDALGIVVTDLAPATLSDLSWTCTPSDGSSCPAAGSGVPAFQADVRVGGQLDITLQATIAPDLLGQLINVVLLTPEPDSTDPTPLDQRAEWITNVVLRPDVAVTKTTLTDPVVAGLPIEYLLDAVNNGLSDAPSVRLSDVLPASLLEASWTCTATGGASCPATGDGSIDLSIAMPAGSSVQFLIAAQVSAAATGTLQNRFSAEVLAPALDPDQTNNLAEVLDPVLVRPDIRLELQAPLNPFDPAGPVALPLLATIVNDGPSNARNVELLIDFDAPVTQTEAGCTQPSPTRVRCLVSQLNPDQVRVLQLRLTGVPPAPGQLAVDAAMTTSGDDPDLSNNSASLVIDLVTGIDLVVSADNGFDWVSPDQLLEYLIRIDNYGSVAASFVDIDIPVPAELLEAEWTCQASGGASCTASGSGAIVDTAAVPRGGSLSYRLAVRVDPALDLSVPQSVTLLVEVPTAPPADDINPLNNIAVDQDEIRLVMFSDGFESNARIPAAESTVDGCVEVGLDLQVLSNSAPGRLLEGRADGGELLFWLDRSARSNAIWLRLAGIGRDGLLDSGWLPAARGRPRLRLDGSVMELFDRDDSIWLAPVGLAAPVAVLWRVELDAETLPAHEPLSINACAAATAGGTNGVSR